MTVQEIAAANQAEETNAGLVIPAAIEVTPATRKHLLDLLGLEMGVLASVSESQPHENDVYNIYHKGYDGDVVIPPHSFSFPSMY